MKVGGCGQKKDKFSYATQQKLSGSFQWPSLSHGSDQTKLDYQEQPTIFKQQSDWTNGSPNCSLHGRAFQFPRNQTNNHVQTTVSNVELKDIFSYLIIARFPPCGSLSYMRPSGA